MYLLAVLKQKQSYGIRRCMQHSKIFLNYLNFSTIHCIEFTQKIKWNENRVEDHQSNISTKLVLNGRVLCAEMIKMWKAYTRRRMQSDENTSHDHSGPKNNRKFMHDNKQRYFLIFSHIFFSVYFKSGL